MTLYGQGEGGQTVQVTVVDFDDKEVTIDFNHPLAGKDLEFDVTVTSARPATDEEAATGQVGGGCTDGSCGCGH
jgi:FKBP-type peptidyl-prolyl cis-trans isomerase SlyD